MRTVISIVIEIRVKAFITFASRVTQTISDQFSITCIAIASQAVARTIAGVAIWRAGVAGHIDDILEEFKRTIGHTVFTFYEIVS